MLKPSRMTKIRLILSREYYNDSLAALQDLGAVQIEAMGEDSLKLLKSGEGIDYKEISDMSQRFRGLDSILYKEGSNEKFAFSNIQQLRDYASSIKIDERAAAIKRELDGISATSKDIQQKLSLIERIAMFGRDIGILNSRSIRSFVAHGKELRQLKEQIQAKMRDVVVVDLQKCAIISIQKDVEKDFALIAEKRKISLEVIPELHGTTKELITHFQKQLEHMNTRKKNLEDELHVISEKWYPLVSALREQLDIEMEKFEITNKIGIGDSIVVVEGWVPSGNIGNLENLVKSVTKEHYMLETIDSKELPPTRLDNPVITRLFEFFIRFYSLPRSDEFDPTVIFAIVFPIFFGLMVGDFGYGAIMLAGSLWLIHRLNHPPKKSRIPRKISSFVTMIIGPSGMMTLAKAIIPGSIISMVLGFVFNEYFGFQLPYTAIFNVETSLSTLLLIAGYIGVFMVEFGLILGFLNKISHNEKRHAAAKLGWFSTALGIVIFGLSVLHKAPLGFSNPLAIISYILIIAGIGVVFYGEGSQSLMEIPSIVSHILSYVRLVGILLTSIILAGIIDKIFLHGISHSILLAIVGTVILVFGQLFNLVIALFESGIQGARLIYVEFFSKFYTGNGIPFRPFKSARKRTLSKFSIDR